MTLTPEERARAYEETCSHRRGGPACLACIAAAIRAAVAEEREACAEAVKDVGANWLERSDSDRLDQGIKQGLRIALAALEARSQETAP
jgi:hypothetical protein